MSLTFLETEGSIFRSQQPAAGTYRQPESLLEDDVFISGELSPGIKQWT
jgi:hypothetical protein